MPPNYLNDHQLKLWYLMSHHNSDLDSFSLAMGVSDIVWPYSWGEEEGWCIFYYIYEEEERSCELVLSSNPSSELRLKILTSVVGADEKRESSYCLTTNIGSDMSIFREVLKYHLGLDPYIF